ncbi:MAG: hypothetical protein J3R72DRAFT_442583 [Linnemannia gamsii]|nr:MAG: hypothetical protein J3R72DRAFT_442583 [Linnemannia gamsii]
MTSFKAVILLLVAVAATGAVEFADSQNKVWGVPSLFCNDFPHWINDKARAYMIEDTWQCTVYKDFACKGASRLLGPTPWTDVPFAGISSVQCARR